MIDTNIPDEDLRWSVNAAAREFGITAPTLRKRLITAREMAARDKCYSTEQIVKAIFGSIQGERLREIKERADNMALKNASFRGEMLDRGELTRALEGIFLAVNQILSAASLPKELRDDLLSTIATWPVAVANVAVKQRKALRSKEDGLDDEDGEEEADADEEESEAESIYQV